MLLLNVKAHQEIENSSQLEKEFNLILIRVTRESLKSIGKNFDSVVYYVLKQKYNVDEEEIPKHTTEFSKCLETIFGKEGKMYVEKIITVNLYIKIRDTYNEVVERDFSERVEHARRKYLEKKLI